MMHLPDGRPVSTYWHSLFGNSKRIVLLGFGLIICLLVALTIVAGLHVAATNRRMDAIVNVQNAKMELAATMRNAARERSIILYTSIILNDPFLMEDSVFKMANLAGEFIQARETLLAMNLTPEERAVLDRQGELSNVSVPLQRQTMERIQQGSIGEAKELLLRAVREQEKVLEQLDLLVSIQRDATRRGVAEAEASNQRAYWFMALLGLAAVGLGLGTARFVVRRTAAFEDALHQEKELAQVTLQSIGDAVITTDVKGRVEYLSPLAEVLTGWTAAKAIGQPLTKIYCIFHENTREPIRHFGVAEFLDGHSVGTDRHVILVSRTGQEFVISPSTSPIRNRDGTVIGTVLVFHDVTETRDMTRQLTWQATHDPLTGISNRREFEHSLAQLLESARTQGKRHALLFMDLDQFKIVNDTCGHSAGDDLLRQLATILDARIRDCDTIARLGGDEFGVLLVGCPLDRAKEIADDLRQVVESFRFAWQNKTFAIGVSIGLVPITAESESVASLMSIADAACYAAKDKGRNRIQVYEPSDLELRQRHNEMQWLLDITKAIDEQRLCLYFQRIAPVGDAAQNAAPYVELLLRMRDEEGNLVPPQAFIPAAERYGQMASIDRWVIRTALAWIKKLPNDSALPACYSINLSGQSLGEEHFLDFVVQQISEAGLANGTICFEITETAAISNLVAATRFITTLKDMGCLFSLDDFGAGMSSFTYLKNLPVNNIKIDGAFVRDMVDDPIDFAMVDAINRIGHVMGMRTIAEFVENDAILAKLKVLGVDYAQGYGIHRPEPLAVS
jgi:diguanylate cyclase (GGDEF)-like protein/PAS domain S-box-containing protein